MTRHARFQLPKHPKGVACRTEESGAVVAVDASDSEPLVD